MTVTRQESEWAAAVGLTAAFILKPHISLRVLLALPFINKNFGRKIAQRVALLFGALLAGVLIWMTVRHTLTMQLHSYGAMVHQELAGGSMDPGNRELLTIPAQISSLELLIGYWAPHARWLGLGSAIVLAALGALLAWASWRLRRTSADLRYHVAGAWCASGMIATYHRAHDGLVLLVLLPWLASRIRKNWADISAWWLLLLVLVAQGRRVLSCFDCRATTCF